MSVLAREILALVVFLYAFHAYAGKLPENGVHTFHGEEGADVWLEIAEAHVIYIGETHDSETDHAYELRLIRGMIRRRMAFAVGWEMFDRTQQGLLDAWDRGSIS